MKEDTLKFSFLLSPFNSQNLTAIFMSTTDMHMLYGAKCKIHVTFWENHQGYSGVNILNVQCCTCAIGAYQWKSLRTTSIKHSIKTKQKTNTKNYIPLNRQMIVNTLTSFLVKAISTVSNTRVNFILLNTAKHCWC